MENFKDVFIRVSDQINSTSLLSLADFVKKGDAENLASAEKETLFAGCLSLFRELRSSQGDSEDEEHFLKRMGMTIAEKCATFSESFRVLRTLNSLRNNEFAESSKEDLIQTVELLAREFNSRLQEYEEPVLEVKIESLDDMDYEEEYPEEFDHPSSSFNSNQQKDVLSSHYDDENSSNLTINPDYTTPLECSQCSATFLNLRSLNKHVKRAHQSEPSIEENDEMHFVCEICEEAKRSLESLKNHVNQEHGWNYPDSSSDDKTTCFFCHLVLSSPEDLIQHYDAKHRTNRGFSCLLCNKFLKSVDILKGHIITAHENVSGRLYSCNICHPSISYDQKSFLNTHLKENHPQLFKYKCSKCDKKFRLASTLHSHFRRHENQLDYICQYCGYATVTSSSLKNHIVHVHKKDYSQGSEDWEDDEEEDSFSYEEDLRLHCPLCELFFSTETELRSHIQSDHSESEFQTYEKTSNFFSNPLQGTNKCFVCSEEVLKFPDHMLKFHPGVPYVPCPSCSYYFRDKTILRHHFRKFHQPQRAINCEECKKVFNSEHARKIHFRLKHAPDARSRSTAPSAQAHICEMCGKSFANYNNLKNHHFAIHSDRTIVCKYSCGICHMKFSESQKLRVHYDVVHPGQRRFSCPHSKECTYQTDIRACMTKHLKWVHKVMPEMKYSCGICKIKISSSHEMRDHYKSVHPGQPRFQCPHCNAFGANVSAVYKRHLRRKHNITC